MIQQRVPASSASLPLRAQGERGGRRGQRAGGAQRPQRVRKRSKMLTEYLTDEEGEGGSGGGRAAKRRAHLE